MISIFHQVFNYLKSHKISFRDLFEKFEALIHMEKYVIIIISTSKENKGKSLVENDLKVA